MFCLPNFVGVVVFVVFPVTASLLLSFCYWRGSRLELDAIRWAGLDNFRQLLGFRTSASGIQLTVGWMWVIGLVALIILAARHVEAIRRAGQVAAIVGLLILTGGGYVYWSRLIRPEWNDPLFWQAFWNSFVLMTWGVGGRIVLCLAMAMMLNQRLREILVYRTIYFLPTVSSAIALYILWQALYHPDVGVINRSILQMRDGFNALVAWLGGPAQWITVRPPNWLGDPTTAKPAFILMGWWQQVGGLTMLLYLAALQGIPEQLYEAADIDGATAWRKFRHITWPMISPTTFFIFIMGVVRGFQGGFQQAYIMTRGGPAGSTTTIDYFIYNEAFFQNQEMGYASAAAWVLFSVILVLTLINWRYGQRRVHY
jgi:multiple sugar transport system permease protein